MFQFYLSSIKRHLMTQNISENNCFNSTLVQLKVIRFNRTQRQIKRFNSTLVQLKVTTTRRYLLPRICFNSTLVQLKVWFDRATNTLQISFNSTLVQLKVNTDGILNAASKMISHHIIPGTLFFTTSTG